MDHGINLQLETFDGTEYRNFSLYSFFVFLFYWHVSMKVKFKPFLISSNKDANLVFNETSIVYKFLEVQIMVFSLRGDIH